MIQSLSSMSIYNFAYDMICVSNAAKAFCKAHGDESTRQVWCRNCRTSIRSEAIFTRYWEQIFIETCSSAWMKFQSGNSQYSAQCFQLFFPGWTILDIVRNWNVILKHHDLQTYLNWLQLRTLSHQIYQQRQSTIVLDCGPFCTWSTHEEMWEYRDITFGFPILLQRTRRLEWPETDSTNIPIALKMPGLSRSCPAGGCKEIRRVRRLKEAILIASDFEVDKNTLWIVQCHSSWIHLSCKWHLT